MEVVGVSVGVALLAGLLVALAAHRWPRIDLAAPHLQPDPSVIRRRFQRYRALRSLLARQVDPVTATGLVVTVATAVLVLAAIAVGLLLLMAQHNAGLAKWDLSYARWGGDHATTGSTRVMRDISLLGGTAGVLTIAVVVGVLEYRRRPNRSIPYLLALTIGGQFALANVIKLFVDRDRPDILQLTGFASSSFPSGHSAAAAATFAVLALLLGRGRSRGVRNGLAAGAVALAVLVASSRVMLGVHWFTDVLAGLALGWGWLAMCSIAFGGRLLHFGQPVQAAEEAVAATAPVGRERPSP